MKIMTNNAFNATVQRAEMRGVHKERERQFEERNKQYEFEENQLVGQKVIAIGNEWCDPLVGTLLRYERHPGNTSGPGWPIIKDALTGEEGCSGGIILLFEPERLQVLCSMPPDVRYHMLSKLGQSYHTSDWSHLKEYGQKLMTYDEFHVKLSDAGFMDVDTLMSFSIAYAERGDEGCFENFMKFHCQAASASHAIEQFYDVFPHDSGYVMVDGPIITARPKEGEE